VVATLLVLSVGISLLHASNVGSPVFASHETRPGQNSEKYRKRDFCPHHYFQSAHGRQCVVAGGPPYGHPHLGAVLGSGHMGL